MKNVLPFLVLIIFFGCKKDSDKVSIAKSWKWSSMNIFGPDGTSYPVDLALCEAGRIWTFKKDRTYLDEPPPPCVSGFDDNPQGIWSLSNNTLKIQFTGTRTGFADMEFKIVKLTTSQLILSRTRPDYGGGGGGFGTSPNEVQYGFVAK